MAILRLLIRDVDFCLASWPPVVPPPPSESHKVPCFCCRRQHPHTPWVDSTRSMPSCKATACRQLSMFPTVLHPCATFMVKVRIDSHCSSRSIIRKLHPSGPDDETRRPIGQWSLITLCTLHWRHISYSSLSLDLSLLSLSRVLLFTFCIPTL